MEMAWLAPDFGGGTKILHLRLKPTDRWQPYTAFPQYAKPDYQIPNGSKGYATMQFLLKQNWTLVASSEA